MKKVLVTGSSGLIGSEVVEFFGRRGFVVHGIDNNLRAVFFGSQGDTRWRQQQLLDTIPSFGHHELDIRDRQGVLDLVKTLRPDVIIHTAAQPSHDLASDIPFDDFDTNAGGTLNLLEATRRYSRESPFIHLSSNKVYGDRPNSIPLVELETRWDFADPDFADGISEDLSIDQSRHSLFGVSKVAADILVQEYGRYFGLPTCVLRGGCLTGPNHSGVELHGFLSYLIKCNLEEREYKIFGYKGKQVRDNLHAADVVNFMDLFIDSPRCGEVYNLGGGKENSCSILEAFALVEECSGKPQRYRYSAQPRLGDHICYYSNLVKIRADYPNWEIRHPLRDIIAAIVAAWQRRGG